MPNVNEQSQRIEKLEEDVSKVKEHSQEIERLKRDITQVKEHTQQVEKVKKMNDNYAPFVWKIPNFQTVYDQYVRKDMRGNISRVINFSDHSHYRPLVEKDVEYGFPDFVSQDVLRSRSYVKANTVFIMASREYRT